MLMPAKFLRAVAPIPKGLVIGSTAFDVRSALNSNNNLRSRTYLITPHTPLEGFDACPSKLN
jgi:hypothetical protein